MRSANPLPSTKMSPPEGWAAAGSSQSERVLSPGGGAPANQRAALWRDAEAALPGNEQLQKEAQKSSNCRFVFSDVEKRTELSFNQTGNAFILFLQARPRCVCACVCVCWGGWQRHAGGMKAVRAPLLWQH